MAKRAERVPKRRAVYPPIDVLPCLSRLMNLGIGEGKTREDHRAVANQMYAAYAQGRDLRKLVAIVGEDSCFSASRVTSMTNAAWMSPVSTTKFFC